MVIEFFVILLPRMLERFWSWLFGLGLGFWVFDFLVFDSSLLVIALAKAKNPRPKTQNRFSMGISRAHS